MDILINCKLRLIKQKLLIRILLFHFLSQKKKQKREFILGFDPLGTWVVNNVHRIRGRQPTQAPKSTRQPKSSGIQRPELTKDKCSACIHTYM